MMYRVYKPFELRTEIVSQGCLKFPSPSIDLSKCFFRDYVVEVIIFVDPMVLKAK